MNRTLLSTRTHLARALSILLDASILTLLAVALVIVITGGGVLELGSVRVRARSVENPLLIVAAAVTLRYAVRRWSPFMGIRRLPMETLNAAGLRFSCDWIPAHVAQPFTRPLVALAGIGLAAFLVKVLLAWQLPGFFLAETTLKSTK